MKIQAGQICSEVPITFRLSRNEFRKDRSDDIYKNSDRDLHQHALKDITSMLTTMSAKLNKSSPLEVKNAVVEVDGQVQEDVEVFRTDVEGENYRTVSW